MKLLFLHIPHWTGVDSATPRVSAGMLRTASAAIEQGFEVRLENLYLRWLSGKSTDVSEILDSRVDCVAVSLHWSLQLAQTDRVVNDLLRSGRKVVVGGLTASCFLDDLNRRFPGATVFPGDGEGLGWLGLQRSRRSLIPADLVDQIEAETEKAVGFWSRSNFGSTRVLVPGAGCLRHCTMCGAPSTGSWWLSVRTVIARMEFDRNRGVNHHYICCDPDPGIYYFEQLLQALVERRWPGTVSLSIYDPLSDVVIDLVSRLPSVGVVELSPDSADSRVRCLTKNTSTVSEIQVYEQAIERLLMCGAEVQVYCSYFLPGDSIITVKRTAEWLWELGVKYGARISSYYLPSTTDPGSAAFQAPTQFGLIPLQRRYDQLVELVRLYEQAKSIANPLTSLPSGICASEAWRLAATIELHEFNRRSQQHGRDCLGPRTFAESWALASEMASEIVSQASYVRITAKCEKSLRWQYAWSRM